MFKIRSMKLIVRCSNGEGTNLSQGNLVSSAELTMYIGHGGEFLKLTAFRAFRNHKPNVCQACLGVINTAVCLDRILSALRINRMTRNKMNGHQKFENAINFVILKTKAI